MPMQPNPIAATSQAPFLTMQNYWTSYIESNAPGSEDRFVILNNTNKYNNKSITVCGIFDGHGGHLVAEHAQQTLCQNVMQQLVSLKSVPTTTSTTSTTTATNNDTNENTNTNTNTVGFNLFP